MTSVTGVAFRVLGVAKPKGSTKAFMRPGMKFPVVTSDNLGVKGWEAAVRSAAQQQCAGAFFEGAVRLRVVFDLPRPKTLPKRVLHHVKKPDLDKLARAVKDALKGIVWTDDSQVVELAARKRYAEGQPQAVILIEVADHA